MSTCSFTCTNHCVGISIKRKLAELALLRLRNITENYPHTMILTQLTLQNEQKAQVWAFLLWKDSQIQQEGSDRDTANSWKLYQKWCKMDTHIRDSWIAAGKTIQTFTKISNAKMQEVSVRQQTTGNPEGE